MLKHRFRQMENRQPQNLTLLRQMMILYFPRVSLLILIVFGCDMDSIINIYTKPKGPYPIDPGKSCARLCFHALVSKRLSPNEKHIDAELDHLRWHLDGCLWHEDLKVRLQYF